MGILFDRNRPRDRAVHLLLMGPWFRLQEERLSAFIRKEPVNEL
jgi:hypothetical protein